MRTGDLWDVPPFPVSRYGDVSWEEWRKAEPIVEAGYQFKCQDACRLKHVPFAPGWLNAVTGLLADELGAPVQQAVTVVRMRART